MITEQQYLDALQLIDAYNRQNNSIQKMDYNLRLSYIYEAIPVLFDKYEIGKSRKREYVYFRQAIAMFLYVNTTLSLSEIGAMIGGKDHATVLHIKKQHNALMEHSYAEDYHSIWNTVKKELAHLKGFNKKRSSHVVYNVKTQRK